MGSEKVARFERKKETADKGLFKCACREGIKWPLTKNRNLAKWLLLKKFNTAALDNKETELYSDHAPKNAEWEEEGREKKKKEDHRKISDLREK